MGALHAPSRKASSSEEWARCPASAARATIGILAITERTYVPRQCDIQVDRMRVVMNKVQGARSVVSLCTLLAVAVVLWQGTGTTRAQGPPPAPGDEEASAAHLSPDGCSELIINGGFEATDLHWGLAGSALPPSYSTAKAHAGQRSLRLGIVDSANLEASNHLYQDIALPDSAQHFTLSFHYWASHEDTPGSDMQLLNIYETTTGVRLAQPWSRLSNEQTWQFEQIDLTHFRGRTLRIEFGVHNDGGGGRTALYLDEVSLLACEPDATPFVTPPATAAPPQPSGTPPPAATTQPVTTPVPDGCSRERFAGQRRLRRRAGRPVQLDRGRIGGPSHSRQPAVRGRPVIAAGQPAWQRHAESPILLLRAPAGPACRPARRAHH